MKTQNRLKKLLEQKEKVEQLIEAENKKFEEQEKANYTKKCIVVGSVILDLIKKKNEQAKNMTAILDANIKLKKDRILLGLPDQSDS